MRALVCSIWLLIMAIRLASVVLTSLRVWSMSTPPTCLKILVSEWGGVYLLERSGTLCDEVYFFEYEGILALLLEQAVAALE